MVALNSAQVSESISQGPTSAFEIKRDVNVSELGFPLELM